MSDNRLNENEISALLHAFERVTEDNASSLRQSTTFRALLILINIYFFTFLFIYFLSVNDLIYTPGQILNDEGVRTTINGRAHIVLWLLFGLNISAYFGIGFRTACLTMFIYVSNMVVDHLVLFSGELSFSQRPYITSFVVSIPVALCGIAWMGIVFKSSVESEEL